VHENRRTSGRAAMEWTVTIEGRDELDEIPRAQLRIEK
jgi:hypothetical protein